MCITYNLFVYIFKTVLNVMWLWSQRKYDMSFYRYFRCLKTAILGPWEVLEKSLNSVLSFCYEPWIINGDSGCRWWQPIQADSQPKLVGLVWGLAAAWCLVCIHWNELSELSQWPCHYDCTSNIGISIIIVICVLFEQLSHSWLAIG